MDPYVTFRSEDGLVVEPGESIDTTVLVKNRDELISEYELAVVGPAASFATVTPATVSLGPANRQDSSAECTVTIKPPFDSNSISGRVPFGVIAVSKESAGHSAVAEGELHVGGISMVDVDVRPSISTGRWSGKHAVEIDNTGNQAMQLSLKAMDPEGALTPAPLHPNSVTVPPHQFREAFAKVRAKKLHFFGRPIDHKFEIHYNRSADRTLQLVSATAAPTTTETVAAVYRQKPIISKWMIVVALFILAAVIAALIRGLTGGAPVVEAASDPTPPPPTDVRIDPSRQLESIAVSWVPPANTGAVTGYEVFFVDQNLRVISSLIVEGGPTSTVPAEELAAAIDEALPDDFGGEELCVLVQSTFSADAGEFRSVFGDGAGMGIRTEDPVPTCAVLPTDDCQSPRIISAEPGTPPTQIEIELAYDDSPTCAAGEDDVIALRGDGIELEVPTGNDFESFFTDVSSVPGEAGDTIVFEVALGGRPPTEFEFPVSDIIERAQEIEDAEQAELDEEAEEDAEDEEEEEEEEEEEDEEEEDEEDDEGEGEAEGLAPPETPYVVVLRYDMEAALAFDPIQRELFKDWLVSFDSLARGLCEGSPCTTEFRLSDEYLTSLEGTSIGEDLKLINARGIDDGQRRWLIHATNFSSPAQAEDLCREIGEAFLALTDPTTPGAVEWNPVWGPLPIPCRDGVNGLVTG